jgi:hypothetical protein
MGSSDKLYKLVMKMTTFMDPKIYWWVHKSDASIVNTSKLDVIEACCEDGNWNESVN